MIDDRDLFGEIIRDEIKMAEDFVLPPYAVFDSRQGYYQDRKRKWIAFGIRSEEGRDEELTYNGNIRLFNYYRVKEGLAQSSTAQGTSIFDPVLCEFLIKHFSPPRGLIIDAFAGGSVRGIVSVVLGRRYIGVDLSADQVAANYEQALAIATLPAIPDWRVGDGRSIDSIVREAADFVLMCPPYYNLEEYSTDPQDLSRATSYDAFLDAYRTVLRATFGRLAHDRFAALVVMDFRGEDGCYHHFVGDTITIARTCGLRLFNDCVLLTPTGTLPIRASFVFDKTLKLLHGHQNVLIFVKGDQEAAMRACRRG